MSPLFGPSADAILATGAPTPGTLVGIRVTLPDSESSVERHEFAVEAGGTVFGIRQNLSPVDEVRLGMPLPLRVQGSAAIIEWGEVDLFGWKSVTPPPRGISDRRDTSGTSTGLDSARRKGESVTAEIVEFTPRAMMLGLAEVIDARCRITAADGTVTDAIVTPLSAPFYATHLVTVGARLPAWRVRGLLGERVTLDWPAAAEAEPGIGRPPAERTGARLTGEGIANAVGMSADAAAPAEAVDLPPAAQALLSKFGVTMPAGAIDTATVDDVVSWQTFLTMQHDIAWKSIGRKDIEAYAVSLGIPPGEWPAAEKRWQQRMGEDFSLAQEYGAAMSRP